MKKITLLLIAVLCLTSLKLMADKPITVEQLPKAALTFLQENFPEQKIILAVKDGRTYEARLMNGTKVDFNKKGLWKSIDCNLEPVPEHLIPQPILDYAKANFPNFFITQIDKERYGYEVELNNDINLKFNHAGLIIGIDD